MSKLVIRKSSDLALYERMQSAIAECYSIDDCKQIATQAGAIAAYYKQIQDDESVRKFLQIKFRAWRRIGEILVSANVDKSKCYTLDDGSFNRAEYIRQIRSAFNGQKAIEELSDGAFRQALKIAELPGEFFDEHVSECGSIEGLLAAFARAQRQAWEKTPEGRAELREWEKTEKRRKAEEARQLQEQEQRAEQQRERMRDAQKLLHARDQAFDEVGVTLDRRDREQMHATVFLLKKSIHEILRQAAFDNRMTMQAILRAGLMMWFIAHGYSISADDMNLPNRKDRRAKERAI